RLFAFRHFERSLPSNSTLASEGGSLLLLPGTMIGGSFFGGGNAACCAGRPAAATAQRQHETANIESIANVVRLLMNKSPDINDGCFGIQGEAGGSIAGFHFSFAIDAPGLTETFTKALDQQHWNPRPPSPDASLATTRKTYSPGSLNVAAVVAFPVNTGTGVTLLSVFSTVGLLFVNETLPGPRNLPHEAVTGAFLMP